MARAHSAPARSAESLHSTVPASSALLMLGGAAAGCGTWLGTYTDSVSIGEDSRIIALGLTIIISLLVSFSPAITSLQMLVKMYCEPPPKQQQPSSNTAEQMASPSSRSDNTHKPETAGSGTTSPKGSNNSASPAVPKGSRTENAKPLRKPQTVKDLYRKKRQQLAGLVLLMLVVWAVFGMMGPSGAVTLTCFIVAVSALRAATAKA